MQKKFRLIQLILVLLSTISSTSLRLIVDAIVEMVLDSVEDCDFDQSVVVPLVQSIRAMNERIEVELYSTGIEAHHGATSNAEPICS